MKRRIGILLTAMLFMLALAAPASANGVVPKPNNGYVVDDAGVLSAGTMSELNSLGQITEANTGTTVASSPWTILARMRLMPMWMRCFPAGALKMA